MFDLDAVRRALHENLSTPPGDDQTKKMLWNLSMALVLIAKRMRIADQHQEEIRYELNRLNSQASIRPISRIRDSTRPDPTSTTSSH